MRLVILIATLATALIMALVHEGSNGLTEADLKEYCNFNAGTTWTYQSDVIHSFQTKNAQSATTYSEITVVKHKDGITFFDGDPSMFLTIKDGYLVNGHIGQEGELNHSIRLLKAGLSKGDSFEPHMTSDAGSFKCTFEGFEDIEVPAGKFRTVCIKWEGLIEKGTVYKFWYAPKVGMVKSIITVPNTIESDMAVSGMRVLKNYIIK